MRSRAGTVAIGRNRYGDRQSWDDPGDPVSHVPPLSFPLSIILGCAPSLRVHSLAIFLITM